MILHLLLVQITHERLSLGGSPASLLPRGTDGPPGATRAAQSGIPTVCTHSDTDTHMRIHQHTCIRSCEITDLNASDGKKEDLHSGCVSCQTRAKCYRWCLVHKQTQAICLALRPHTLLCYPADTQCTSLMHITSIFQV